MPQEKYERVFGNVWKPLKVYSQLAVIRVHINYLRRLHGDCGCLRCKGWVIKRCPGCPQALQDPDSICTGRMQSWVYYGAHI